MHSKGFDMQCSATAASLGRWPLRQPSWRSEMGSPPCGNPPVKFGGILSEYYECLSRHHGGDR